MVRSESNTMEIRRYRPGDLDAVLDIWYEASLLAHPFLTQEFLESERRNIREIYMPEAETWVCVTEGRVRAFIALLGNEVGAIFAHPDHHGRGLGRALMDKAVDLRSELHLDVFKENAIGRAFYDRYGFHPRHEHVHEETGHTLIRMEYSRAQENR